MAQLKTIAEVDSTIRILGHVIESMPNEELSKLLCDPLCYALIACKAVNGQKKFKDSENAPAHLERKINDILQIMSEATIAPSHQQKVSTLVKQLQEFKIENLKDATKQINVTEVNNSDPLSVTMSM